MEEVIKSIKPVSEEDRVQARKHWETLAKPIDGLGDMEELIVRIAALRGSVTFAHPRLYVCCADNGVVMEGVSQSGQEVTARVAEALAAGESTVSHMALEQGIEVIPVDAGIACVYKPEGIEDRRVRKGICTGNVVREAAMTREECIRAIEAGIALAGEAVREGVDILLTGEMGIGNTTTATLVAGGLLGQEPEQLAGPGAGLSREGVERKREIIHRAWERYKRLADMDPKWNTNGDPNRESDVNHQAELDGDRHAGFDKELEEDRHAGFDVNPVIRLMSELGGFDIAMMCGIFLGGAYYRIPVVIDGLISAVAALCAVRLCPAAGDAMLGSHMPSEPAGVAVFRALKDYLKVSPVIHAGMHLGEGTGAVLLIPMLRMCGAVYTRGHVFSDIRVTPYVRYDHDRQG